jgi:hypothetical protein
MNYQHSNEEVVSSSSDSSSIVSDTENNIKEETKDQSDDEIKKAKKGGGANREEDRSFIDFLKLPKCLHNRTGMCRHKYGCIENTMRGLYRMFWITFVAKTVLSNLFLLIKPIKLINNL